MSQCSIAPGEKEEPNPESAEQKPRKKRSSKLERLAQRIPLDLYLSWVRLSNIPPKAKQDIMWGLTALHKQVFPHKTSERRKRQTKEAPEKPKQKSSGRRGAQDFPEASKIKHSQSEVQEGSPCLCGGVFGKKPALQSVQFIAAPPIKVIINECECFRCSSCNVTVRAKLPEGEDKRHHPSAISMVALLRYGSGFPFYRLQTFLGHLGVGLAASTQFEMVKAGLPAVEPVYEELQKQAALAELIQADDTSARIIKLERPKEFSKRTGVFTTGILAILGLHKIGIFQTGAKHTGENVADLLSLRPKSLLDPIFMADALERNFSRAIKEACLLANCLSHGRRYFVDLNDAFPQECEYVLDALGTVFFNESLAKLHQLNPEERLWFHQRFSESVMTKLQVWMQEKLDKHKIEANSRLGKAFNYMLKNWERLTLFLKQKGAPLDNNAVERLLKKSVLHRKNSFQYRNQNGAKAGDICMSLIYTCEINNQNAFDYLTQIQIHANEVKKSPGDWLPWTYQESLRNLAELRDMHSPRGSPLIAA
jgi:transposase